MSAAPARERAPKLPALTSIRAVAAWWVVLFHTKEHLAPFLPRLVLGVIGAGNLGVDLFFVLSGFVIALNYAERMDGGWPSYVDFLKRRFARIYPLHICVLAAMVLYAILVYARSGHLTPNYDFAYLPAHILLVQAWGIDPLLRWNDPAWSISAEMMAYLLFPAIVRLRLRRWPIAAQVAAIAGLIVLLRGCFAALGLDQIGENVMRAGLWRCLCEFTIGAILCAIFLAQRRSAGRWVPTLLIVGSACVAAAGLALELNAIIVVPIVFALLVLGLAFANARGRTILDAPLLVYLGDISYSTYLVHFFVLVLLKAPLRPGALIPPAELAAYFVLVLIGSMLLYARVELPAQRELLARLGLRARSPVPVGAP